MKISINTPIARLEAYLPEVQVKELLQIAVDYVTGGTVNVFRPVDDAQQANPAPRIEILTDDSKAKHGATEDGYKGFLYIKCEECGLTKGFCVKSTIKESRCDCGHATHLVDLKPMYVNCRCGKSFKYLTNLTDSIISMNCIHCGSPVDLEYHDKKRVYQTIGGSE